ncbi:ROK family protein [Actinoplanes sp. DH11]|uniref:ROK family protein n=1 Tax=Actinoplanes sp. DH11 TaxID=2857011 RepID=UPI001E5FE8F8|nr:ROK family protein [Actinoplanes sp. DH11]
MTASYLGIDVGGTKVAVRTESGAAPPRTSSLRWRPGVSVADDLADLAAHLRDLPPGVCSAGVAMPATVDDDGAVTAWPTRPGWIGVDLAAAFGGLLPGIPVRWADDGGLAALAESRAHGADLLYVGVGTGIGGGVVHAGRSLPVRGSCELGHLVVDRSGPRCDCGRAGCLQAIASGPATLRNAAALRGRPVGFAELRDGWLCGAAWAREAVADSCAALAAAVVGVGELLGPPLAVIGGGFAAGLPGFCEEVAGRTAALARAGHQPPEVRPSAYGALASLHGAVLLARSTV